MQFSMHLCGSWVRSVCAGDGLIFKDWISAYFDMFDRIQLNFHQIPHRTNDDKFVAILKGIGLPIIYQMDNVNNRIFLQARKLNLDCSPLYDISGGRGILPKTWIKPTSNYCGYAGGLSPDNLKENLDKLSDIVGDVPVWIDAETHLRSHNDTVFDIDKVIRFCEIAKPYVMGKK
jgi:phosphoribosylanthranilate isomerase